MALILNIDTAVEAASLCLAKEHEIITLISNAKQKDHATWLHVAIKEIIEKNKLDSQTIDAIAVTGGPGSYTGLRIGMSTAKGLCFALNKPMIVLNTLLVMANAAKDACTDRSGEHADLLCPMIDARRMDVFTAMYTKDLQQVQEPRAVTIHEESFEEELKKQQDLLFW